MQKVEDVHSSGTYQFIANHFPIIDYSTAKTDKKTKDCKRCDARRTTIGNLFNHVLISSNCHPAFIHNSGNTDCGYQLDSCGTVYKIDENTLKLDIIDDIILYPPQSRFMVQDGNVVSAILRYLQASIDVSYYSMTGERKFRCFDWGRMKKNCCSPSNIKNSNSCHWFCIKRYDHEQNNALISLKLLWLQEKDFAMLYPIHMELRTRDNPSIPILELLFSQQEDIFTMVDYTKFSESTMLRDKYNSKTSSHIDEETNVHVNGEMISIIFYDPGIPSVARYDVFHYSWIVLKQFMLSFLNWGRTDVGFLPLSGETPEDGFAWLSCYITKAKACIDVGFLPLSGETPEDGFAWLSCYITKAKACIGMCLFNQSSCRYMWMI
jgi:hypothetical protein